MTHVTAAEARRRLGHPVVDADGHFIELMPLVDDEVLTYLEESGGPELRDRYRERAVWNLDTVQFQDDRRHPDVVDNWRAMPSWWGNPVADARERATAHLPRLLYDRLDDLGVDLMLAYPSWTLGFLMDSDATLRAPACRAVNRYTARLFAPYADRLRGVALIPMETPREAVAEIDHAVGELGHTLVLLAGFATRPVGASGSRLDVFGIDSAFDYDPVWAACVRNRVAPVFHSSVQYTHPARSISNYVFNHIGGIAHAHEALCKALFMGGVYGRFPELRFGYLEGGVMWGASLLADMVGHWEKRGGHAIDSLDPSRLDVAAVMALLQAHGTDDMVANADRIAQYLARMHRSHTVCRPIHRHSPSVIVHNLDIDRAGLGPCEANAPLIIDADAPLTDPVALERFEPIARRGPQKIERLRRVQHGQFARRHGLDSPKALRMPAFKNGLRILAAKRLDHGRMILRYA